MFLDEIIFNKILALLFFLLATLLAGCDIKLDSSAVDADEYLKVKKNPVEIYKKNDKGYLYLPFNFGHTEYGKLILMSIEGHPQIKTVELVVQHDNKGAFVIVYGQNGKADIYTNPYLTVDKKYLEPNQDWKIIGEQNFNFSFGETNKGISLTLDITIKNNQQIKIKLNETLKDPKRYSFLAAIGADLSDVKRFPFVYLKDAGFVPIEGTKVDFQINGTKMELTKVPLKVEGKKSYRIVYSLTPLLFFWNEERDNYLLPEIIKSSKSYKKNNILYTFKENHGFKEIERIVYTATGHKASYRFSPSFPDIGALVAGSTVNGKFCLGIDDIEGVICGKYDVIKSDNEIAINFLPEKCWQPMPGKDWVSAYRYNAKLRLTSSGQYKIHSVWTIND